MQIAVLDNDRSRVDLMRESLVKLDHDCRHFDSSKSLLEHLTRDGFDLLIMDWQVADHQDVIRIVRTVREQGPSEAPILFLADHSAEEEIVSAMEAGASDYIVKPIRRGELVTRVQALLKRAYPELRAGEQLRFGQYAFETGADRLTMAGKTVDVTHKEFELALLLFRNIGRPLSRAYIREAIWTGEPNVPSRTMDTHVSRVRSKLGLRPENGFRLVPVYSYGYRLEQLP
jgi:DNA-binding response OmpR family regulator